MLVKWNYYKQLPQGDEHHQRQLSASELDFYYYTYLLNNHPDKINKITDDDIDISIEKYSPSPLLISQFRKMAKNKLSHLNRCCILSTNRPASIPEEEEDVEEQNEMEEEEEEEEEETRVEIESKTMQTLMVNEVNQQTNNECNSNLQNHDACHQLLINSYADNHHIDEGIYENYQRGSSFRHDILSCIKDTSKHSNNDKEWSTIPRDDDVVLDACNHGIYWPECDGISSRSYRNTSHHHNGYLNKNNDNNLSSDSIYVKSEPLYYCTPGTQKEPIYINKYKKKNKRNKRRNSVSFDLSSTLSDDCSNLIISQSSCDSDQNWFGSGRNLWLANTNKGEHYNHNDNSSNILPTDSECTTTYREIFDTFTLCSNCSSSCSNDSYSNHRDNNHPHCLCSENDDVDDSCQTTITVTNPLVHSTVTSESTQSREGSHSASALPYINSVANNSETNVIGIQLKNNASQSSVCFASSPRGNTVITHHPASPFSRVPRSTVGKNGINLKTSPIQSTQSSISKSNVCITATAMTTTATTTACIDNFSTNENIPVTNISATSDSSRVLVDFQSDVSDCSSQQQQHIHVNDNQQTSSTYNEANQLIHLTKTNSSVSHGSLTNMTNSSHGLSGRTRSSNVSTSYPTYEEAWDLKLARQLGIGVSRLPSIIPIASSSSSVQNYIPSLPTIPSHTSNTDHSSILILSSTSVDNQNNNHGIKNNSNLPSHQPLTDDMHSLESNMKSLTISASTSSTSTSSSFSSTSNDKRINPTNNSELITTSHVDDLDHVDVKRTYLNKLDQKSTDDTNHLLFPHDELITNHSSHMLNLNLAINNSSGDLSVPLNTPKCSDPMTAAKTEVVRTVKSSLTNPPPPSYHPNYLHHHGLSFSSRLQEFNPTKLASIKSTISNDLKANLTTRTNLQSVLPNDLDSISTSSCDESWDARHGRLVSELMTGRFIDPVAVVPDTGKIKAMTTTTTTTTVNNNDFLNSVTCCNSSEANIPTVSGSCSTSSYSSSSSSSSVSINSHVIIASPAPPPSQCTNSIVQTFDQFTSSSGNSRHSMHSVSRNKLLSSQNNLPKGLPSHLEKLPLEEQPWFHPSLTRSEAEELIRNEPEGSFLVRPSETCPNDFSLTIKHKTFLHMKITRNNAGQFILGEYSQPYSSVSQMIYHYARTLVPVLGAYSVTLTHPVFKRV
ncbi:SH2 domain-containing adapter protein isoform 1 [Schistosoma japonicum]|uniref:SH2 domain-containing adapter protein isoform 1 n=2 Tax=Schistosoma japonicum TaxID=6182 RepID=A0A4Z2DW35_SCHJA|nr:SH2 domain-containing adapter protein isoform 1 [Schistosoma japonicum]